MKNECEPILPGNIFYCRDAFGAINALENKNRPVKKSPTSRKVSEASVEKTLPQRIDRSEPDTPKQPFLGNKTVEEINPDEFLKFVNKYTLFNNRWGYKKNNLTEIEYNNLLKQAGKDFEEMTRVALGENILNPKVSYGYFKCKGVKNSIIIDDRIELEFPRQKNEPHLCIADYFKSHEDVIALQIVTLGNKPAEFTKGLNEKGKFKEYFLYHGYFTEVTEALAEYWHFKVRQELGITKPKEKSVESILRQNYKGLRYSFGYPSCPDLEGNKIIGELLHMKDIGVSITDSLMMVPEFTTSAIIVYNEKAEYFTV